MMSVQIQKVNQLKIGQKRNDMITMLVKQIIKLQNQVNEQNEEIKNRDEVIHNLKEIVTERARWMKWK